MARMHWCLSDVNEIHDLAWHTETNQPSSSTIYPDLTPRGAAPDRTGRTNGNMIAPSPPKLTPPGAVEPLKADPRSVIRPAAPADLLLEPPPDDSSYRMPAARAPWAGPARSPAGPLASRYGTHTASFDSRVPVPAAPRGPRQMTWPARSGSFDSQWPIDSYPSSSMGPAYYPQRATPADFSAPPGSEMPAIDVSPFHPEGSYPFAPAEQPAPVRLPSVFSSGEMFNSPNTSTRFR